MRYFLFFLILVLVLPSKAAQTYAEDRTNLEEEITKREEIVKTLVNSVKDLHAHREASFEDCGCTYHTCGNELGKGLKCTDGLRFSECEGGCKKRLVDYNRSVIRTPFNTNPAALSDSLRQSICAFRGLDKDFQNIKYKYNVANSWTYFGTTDGLMRTWPLRTRAQESPSKDDFLKYCTGYDPRVRPWYSAASIGSKDVVLILDRSTTTQSRIGRLGESSSVWDVIQTAAFSLIKSFTSVDYVNLVFLSVTAERAIEEHPLVAGTVDNLATLGEKVDAAEPSGSTNISGAFEEAFDILTEAQDQNTTSNCTKLILFLAEGRDTVNTNTHILKKIRRRQRQLTAKTGSEAFIFTFSLGFDSDDSIARHIACQNHGVWSRVSSILEPYSDMTSYVRTLSATRTSEEPVWLNPYLDLSGLGNVSTVAAPVFARDQDGKYPVLIGVVGHDVILSDLTVDGSFDYVGVLDALVNRSKNCKPLEVDLCELQVQRQLAHEASVCPDEYPEDACYEFNQTWYRLFEEKVDKERAEERCRSLNGSLASIKSKEQFRLLSGIASPDLSWLSGVRTLVDKSFKFQFSDPDALSISVNDEKWASSQVDSFDKRCMAIDRRGITKNLQRQDCNDQLSFICAFTSSTSCEDGSSVLNLTNKDGKLRNQSTPFPEECKSLTDAIDALKPTNKVEKIRSEDVICEFGDPVFYQHNMCCDECWNESDLSSFQTSSPLISLIIILPLILVLLHFGG